MRLTCPACQAETSLEAAVGREADARALAVFIETNVPLGALLVRYIALFRPAKRRLSLARTVGLFEELRPDLQRGAINRKGRDWAAPLEVWRAAIDQVLAARDKGTLTLPLSSHGYLYEVIVGHADKTEAVAEREVLQAGRARAGSSEAGGPVSVAAWAPVVTGVDLAKPGAERSVTHPPYNQAQGPSRSARETRALMQANLQARRAAPADDDQPEGPQP